MTPGLGKSSTNTPRPPSILKRGKPNCEGVENVDPNCQGLGRLQYLFHLSTSPGILVDKKGEPTPNTGSSCPMTSLRAVAIGSVMAMVVIGAWARWPESALPEGSQANVVIVRKAARRLE